jgi:ABC-type multidrug transport system ATPase subunit
MDEAGRCGRVGFMRTGRILLEGQPDVLRKRLEGRILEVHGEPLPFLRDLARQDPKVEDAQMFGDRLHLRIARGSVGSVMRRLKSSIPEHGGSLSLMRSIAPQLEDVFIDLLENNPTHKARREG